MTSTKEEETKQRDVNVIFCAINSFVLSEAHE